VMVMTLLVLMFGNIGGNARSAGVGKKNPAPAKNSPAQDRRPKRNFMVCEWVVRGNYTTI